jgi:hypothetical protein
MGIGVGVGPGQNDGGPAVGDCVPAENVGRPVAGDIYHVGIGGIGHDGEIVESLTTPVSRRRCRSDGRPGVFGGIVNAVGRIVVHTVSAPGVPKNTG